MYMYMLLHTYTCTYTHTYMSYITTSKYDLSDRRSHVRALFLLCLCRARSRTRSLSLPLSLSRARALSFICALLSLSHPLPSPSLSPSFPPPPPPRPPLTCTPTSRIEEEIYGGGVEILVSVGTSHVLSKCHELNKSFKHHKLHANLFRIFGDSGVSWYESCLV